MGTLDPDTYLTTIVGIHINLGNPYAQYLIMTLMKDE
jgi:hypothetical protein